MPNGSGTGGCCLLGVCCPPKKQAEELANIIEAAGSPQMAAEDILARVDLVAKGVGTSFVKAYREMFREEVQHAEKGTE